VATLLLFNKLTAPVMLGIFTALGGMIVSALSAAWGQVKETFPDFGAWAESAAAAITGFFGQAIAWVKDKLAGLMGWMPDWLKDKLGIKVEAAPEKPQDAPAQIQAPAPASSPVPPAGREKPAPAPEKRQDKPAPVQAPAPASSPVPSAGREKPAPTPEKSQDKPAPAFSPAPEKKQEAPAPLQDAVAGMLSDFVGVLREVALSASSLGAALGDAALSAAALGEARMIPAPAAAAAMTQDNSRASNVTLNAKTDIRVETSDPEAAGRAVAGQQNRVNADTVRNMKGVAR
jgi:hypothetical protein